MVLKMNNKIMEVWFKDLQKPDIDKYERATILKDFMNENKLSIRAFAKKYGFAKSTIEDWLLWIKIEPEKVAKLKKQGVGETEIYRTLRNNKKENVQTLFPTEINTFEVTLWKVYKLLLDGQLGSKINNGKNVKKLVGDIRNLLDEIESRL